MSGWLFTVDAERSGGKTVIQEVYASWFADPVAAMAEVKTLLASGTRVEPRILMEVDDSVMRGLRIEFGEAGRLRNHS